MAHFKSKGVSGSPFTCQLGLMKSIILKSKGTASTAIFTDADGETIEVSAPANDTTQLVMPGSDMHVFNMKAPISVAVTGDADTFVRVDD